MTYESSKISDNEGKERKMLSSRKGEGVIVQLSAGDWGKWTRSEISAEALRDLVPLFNLGVSLPQFSADCWSATPSMKGWKLNSK